MLPASLSLNATPAFFADAMLGRLARWLRILGYDTAYEKFIADDELVARMLAEDRWLLTRDRYLVRRRVLRGRHTLIAHDHIQDQLRQLRRELSLTLLIGDHTAHRCAECNTRLVPIPAAEAAPLLPPFVATQYPSFICCPTCRRLFWPGTQWTSFLNRLARIRQETAQP
jgi:uncharacterized protein with PIN domain